jgi:hypothetical protein
MSTTKPITFIEDGKGCFIITSHKTYGFGYSTIRRNHQVKSIHRLIYEECFGEIPKGLVIRHKCDVPACINPEHLEIGTRADNVRDMFERNRAPERIGSKNFNSKLTENDVIEIKKLLSKGELSQKEIAKKFGVAPGHISGINTGRKWGHL